MILSMQIATESEIENKCTCRGDSTHFIRSAVQIYPSATLYLPHLLSHKQQHCKMRNNSLLLAV